MVSSWDGLPQSAGLTLAARCKSGLLSPEEERTARKQSVCESKVEDNNEKGEREMNGEGTGFCE